MHGMAYLSESNMGSMHARFFTVSLDSCELLCFQGLLKAQHANETPVWRCMQACLRENSLEDEKNAREAGQEAAASEGEGKAARIVPDSRQAAKMSASSHAPTPSSDTQAQNHRAVQRSHSLP
jgi:hypothetical protein